MKKKTNKKKSKSCIYKLYIWLGICVNKIQMIICFKLYLFVLFFLEFIDNL